MQTRLAGDLERVRLDEQSIDPASLMGASSAALIVGGAAVALAVKPVASLFSRVRGADALNHAGRRRLLDAVSQEPGISYNRLLERSGMANGTARHHLSILQNVGLIETRMNGNRLRHYPAGVDPKAQDNLAILVDSRCRALLDKVASQPGLTQADLVTAFPGSRSTAQVLLNKLAVHGLIVARKSGRQCRYYVGLVTLHAGPARARGIFQSRAVPAVPVRPETQGRAMVPKTSA